MHKVKTEAQLLSSFKTYLKTAALLTDDKLKQIRIADQVFIGTYNFSWIQRFEDAYNKLIEKELVIVNAGSEVAERHVTGETSSRGLNKGVAPNGYLNKGDLAKYMNEYFGCPVSLTEAIMDKYKERIVETRYPNEIEIADAVKIVQVPCYLVDDIIGLLFSVVSTAVQKLTKKDKPSCMCYFPELQAKFKFDLEAFKLAYPQSA